MRRRSGRSVRAGGLDLAADARLARVELVEDLLGDTVELFAREEAEEAPCEVERVEDGAVLVDALLDELVLEPAEELDGELQARPSQKGFREKSVGAGRTFSSELSASSPTTAFIAAASFPIAYCVEQFPA